MQHPAEKGDGKTAVNERFQLLAALPGTAIKVMLVFWWENRQLTETELEPRVGHDKSTVRKALAQLALYNLVAKVIGSRETWHLTDKGYQLPLPFVADPRQGVADPLQGNARAGATPGGAKIFSSATTTTTTTTVARPQLFLEQPSSSSRTPSEENLPPCGGDVRPSVENAESPVDAEVSANLVALHKARICGKKAVALARLEWVTPEYIRAMHARWEAEGHTSRETGLLVRYIEDGDPAPIICEECGGVGGHRATCQSFGDLDKLAELVASGEVKGIRHPSSRLVQAMMRYNYEKTVMPY